MAGRSQAGRRSIEQVVNAGEGSIRLWLLLGGQLQVMMQHSAPGAPPADHHCQSHYMAKPLPHLMPCTASPERSWLCQEGRRAISRSKQNKQGGAAASTQATRQGRRQEEAGRICTVRPSHHSAVTPSLTTVLSRRGALALICFHNVFLFVSGHPPGGHPGLCRGTHAAAAQNTAGGVAGDGSRARSAASLHFCCFTADLRARPLAHCAVARSRLNVFH